MTSTRAARLTVAATLVVSLGFLAVATARAQTREAHGGSSGGGGTAVSSGGGGGSSGGGSSGGSNGGSSGGSSGGGVVGTAVPRSSGGGGKASGRDAGTQSGSSGDSGSATGRRTHDGVPVIGTAVPRGTVPVGGGTGVVFVPGGYGFYPWGYGGLGLAGYYGGYYGGYYDSFDSFGAPTYFFPSQSGSGDEGALRLKVKPSDASVYVDGYYVGRVEDFNGVLQRLHLSPGPHRIEIRDDKFEPLTFDVNIDSDHTVTYRGELKKIN